MGSRISFAPGKVIFSGEYAVVFGYPGIAIPAAIGIKAVFEEDSSSESVHFAWEGIDGGEIGLKYVEKIVARVARCHERGELRGKLTIHSELPLGKGMGSSTALVIAVSRALCGDARDVALKIEDELNPGHSGLDFETIWGGAPVLFKKGEAPRSIVLKSDLLSGAVLLDTGFPSESTSALVAWVRSREAEVRGALETIGNCTERLVACEPYEVILRAHHKAQVALGVVPQEVQDIISAIEQAGGAAKVIGAGSRTGGAGMVLALGNREKINAIASKRNLPTILL